MIGRMATVFQVELDVAQGTEVYDRELWILSKKLTGIYFQTEDFALFCCAL